MDVKTRLVVAMREMSEEEMFTALYRDAGTGTLNRRAFQTGMSNVIALVDIDSLKWVNDNKGHREGDLMLSTLATLLQNELGDRNVYRVSGDEFAIRANSSLRLNASLVKVREEFPWFSYGIGRNLQDADGGMRYEKGRRVKDGLRAKRGDAPPDAEATFNGIMKNEPEQLRQASKLAGGSKG